MRIHDLFNSTVGPRVAPGAPTPTGAEQPTTFASFITPQSIVSFPLASGVVAGLWKLVQVFFPEFGASPWAVLIIAMAIGMLIYFISISDSRLRMTRRDKIIAFFIGLLNSLYLLMAALGINPTK